MSGRSLGELARAAGLGLVRADPAALATGVASLESAGPGDVAFYANKAYRRHLAPSRALAIIVSEADAALPELAGRALLVAPAAYAAFAKVSAVFHPPVAFAPGLDPQARVEAGADVDPSATVQAFAYVAKAARVGARAVLMPGVYVGAGAKIGPDAVLHPNVVVRDGCEVGARCILHAGAVVGADGFGFAFDPEGDGEGPVHRKVPQAGIARLEDDVELGANTCVDRATLGETVVGRGTKIDNLVQVAHNVKIGPLGVIAAQSGIAGSTTVGAGVAFGGQVGVVGHVEVGDFVRVGAKAGVFQNVEAGATLHGTPAIESKNWLRAQAIFARLPELQRRLRELEQRLAAVEGRPPVA